MNSFVYHSLSLIFPICIVRYIIEFIISLEFERSIRLCNRTRSLDYEFSIDMVIDIGWGKIVTIDQFIELRHAHADTSTWYDNFSEDVLHNSHVRRRYIEELHISNTMRIDMVKIVDELSVMNYIIDINKEIDKVVVNCDRIRNHYSVTNANEFQFPTEAFKSLMKNILTKDYIKDVTMMTDKNGCDELLIVFVKSLRDIPFPPYLYEFATELCKSKTIGRVCIGDYGRDMIRRDICYVRNEKNTIDHTS